MQLGSKQQKSILFTCRKQGIYWEYLEVPDLGLLTRRLDCRNSGSHAATIWWHVIAVTAAGNEYDHLLFRYHCVNCLRLNNCEKSIWCTELTLGAHSVRGARRNKSVWLRWWLIICVNLAGTQCSDIWTNILYVFMKAFFFFFLFFLGKMNIYISELLSITDYPP